MNKLRKIDDMSLEEIKAKHIRFEKIMLFKGEDNNELELYNFEIVKDFNNKNYPYSIRISNNDIYYLIPVIDVIVNNNNNDLSELTDLTLEKALQKIEIRDFLNFFHSALYNTDLEPEVYAIPDNLTSYVVFNQRNDYTIVNKTKKMISDIYSNVENSNYSREEFETEFEFYFYNRAYSLMSVVNLDVDNVTMISDIEEIFFVLKPYLLKAYSSLLKFGIEKEDLEILLRNKYNMYLNPAQLKKLEKSNKIFKNVEDFYKEIINFKETQSHY